MKCNLGQTEKYVRLLLGVIVFSVGLYAEHHFSGTAGQVLLWLSLALLLTAAFSWCPITSLKLRVTRPRRAESEKVIAVEAEAPPVTPPTPPNE